MIAAIPPIAQVDAPLPGQQEDQTQAPASAPPADFLMALLLQASQISAGLPPAPDAGAAPPSSPSALESAMVPRPSTAPIAPGPNTTTAGHGAVDMMSLVASGPRPSARPTPGLGAPAPAGPATPGSPPAPITGQDVIDLFASLSSYGTTTPASAPAPPAPRPAPTTGQDVIDLFASLSSYGTTTPASRPAPPAPRPAPTTGQDVIDLFASLSSYDTTTPAAPALAARAAPPPIVSAFSGPRDAGSVMAAPAPSASMSERATPVRPAAGPVTGPVSASSAATSLDGSFVSSPPGMVSPSPTPSPIGRWDAAPAVAPATTSRPAAPPRAETAGIDEVITPRRETSAPQAPPAPLVGEAGAERVVASPAPSARPTPRRADPGTPDEPVAPSPPPATAGRAEAGRVSQVVAPPPSSSTERAERLSPIAAPPSAPAPPADPQLATETAVTPASMPVPPRAAIGNPAVAAGDPARAGASIETSVVVEGFVAALAAEAPTDVSPTVAASTDAARVRAVDGGVASSDPRVIETVAGASDRGSAVAPARRGATLAPAEDRGAEGGRVEAPDRRHADMKVDAPTPVVAGVHARASSADAAPAAEAPPPRPVAEQVAEHVSTIRREGRQEMSFRLDPPELGRVRVEAVLEGRHLTLHIRAEEERSRDMLQQDLPRLQETLAQQGFIADRVSIDLDMGAGGRNPAASDFAAFTPPERPDAPSPLRHLPAAAIPRTAPVDGVDIWV